MTDCEACEMGREDHVHPEGCTCEWTGQRRDFMGNMVRIDQPRCPLHGRCAWADCQTPGWHQHGERFGWQRTAMPADVGDAVVERFVVDVDARGFVEISEAALAQLLTDAGWERTA